jgi:hypothetical protein
MELLLIRAESDAEPSLDDRAELARQHLVTCGVGDGGEPCAGWSDRCPLEGSTVDAVVDYRGHRAHVTTDEMGVVCAARAGYPVLVCGGREPFGDRVTVRQEGEPLDEAVARAVREHAARVAGPVRAEVRRILSAHGIESEECNVVLRREGDVARLEVVVPVPLSARVAGQVSVRALAVLQEAPLPVAVTDVRVVTEPSAR